MSESVKTELVDGRRARSEQAIIEASLALMEEGNTSVPFIALVLLS